MTELVPDPGRQVERGESHVRQGRVNGSTRGYQGSGDRGNDGEGKALCRGRPSLLVDWIVEYVKSQGEQLTAGEKRGLHALFNEDESYYGKLAARLPPADRRGFLIVGPSGGGKTSLFNAMTNLAAKADCSTIEIDTGFIQLGGKIRAIRETPGQFAYARDVWPSVKNYKPSMLIIVFADGYLDTVAPAMPSFDPTIGLGRTTTTSTAILKPPARKS